MKNILPIKNKEKDMEDYEDENKVHTFSTIQDLKESFCNWLDYTLQSEGEKETGYKIEDGKLTLRVYDTFITSQNGSKGKTYQIIVEKVDIGKQEVMN